jgi:hypothetical protein
VTIPQSGEKALRTSKNPCRSKGSVNAGAKIPHVEFA